MLGPVAGDGLASRSVREPRLSGASSDMYSTVQRSLRSSRAKWRMAENRKAILIL